MSVMRERVPRPETRDFNRVEYIATIGLAIGAVGWLVLLTRKSAPVDCVVACPPPQYDGDPLGIL